MAGPAPTPPLSAPATSPGGAPSATGTDLADDRAGALLAAHVPLSLLCDLARPLGPDSRWLLEAEGGEAGWLLAVPA